AAILLVLVAYPRQLLALVLGVAPLVWIGRVSYGLYLWHYPVYAAVDDWTTSWTPEEIVALKFGLTFPIAAASYGVVEQPLLRLKSRRFQGGKRSAAAEAVALIPARAHSSGSPGDHRT